MKSLDDIIDNCLCVYGKNDHTDPCKGRAVIRKAMTAYHFEGELNSPEDPNKDFYACDNHYEQYYEYWKMMWDEYYSNVRFL